MKPYRLHFFVCEGKRCSARGSEEIFEVLKDRIKSEVGSAVRVSRSGCLKLCEETEVEGELCPAVVAYPEGIWYKNVSLKDLDDLIEKHAKKGDLVKRLFYHRAF